MHIWDTFCVALHLDGLQCDYFFATLKNRKQVSVFVFQEVF